MADITQAYQRLITELSNANVLSHQSNSQFVVLNPVQVLNCLIPVVPTSFDALENQKLQYFTDLKFPLVNGHAVGVNKLRFMSSTKDFRQSLFGAVSDVVRQCVMTLPSIMPENIDQATMEKLSYIFQTMMANMQPPSQDTATTDPLGSLIPPDIVSKVAGLLTDEETSKIEAQLADLTAAYGHLSLPAIMMHARSDPRFEQLKKTFEEIYSNKSEEDCEKFSSIFSDNPEFIEKMGSLKDGLGASSYVSSAITRGLDSITRPDINDEDPMNLSEAQFDRLKKETLGDKKMQ